jgi:hypothetical protein
MRGPDGWGGVGLGTVKPVPCAVHACMSQGDDARAGRLGRDWIRVQSTVHACLSQTPA